MGAIPTVQDMRDHLEGYCITNTVLSDQWITDERDLTVVPYVEQAIRRSLSQEEEITEYISGTSEGTVMLSRRDINSLVSIELVHHSDFDSHISLNSVILIPEKGIVKSVANFPEYSYSRVFPKGNNNIKIVYKVGGTIPNDIEMAIKKLTCILMLDNIEGRTGGGSLAVQAYRRDFGSKGRYTHIRKRLSLHAMTILRRYTSSVVGN